MNANTILNWLAEAQSQIDANSDYLTQLDAAIGDGDHGTNMRRGFRAVAEALSDEGDNAPPGRLLGIAGKTLVSTVGGASGPLWGSALRRAGRVLASAREFDAQQLARALDEALKTVVELGAAAPGDKTMVDALAPANDALRRALDDGRPLAEAAEVAAGAALKGAEATIPMQARKGRASYLGARSIGHKDPGAASAAIILSALSSAIAQEG